MSVRDFYARLLGLVPPWTVEKVVLEEGAETVEVYVQWAEGGTFPCPRCGHDSPICDSSSSRMWRHADTCGKKTCLFAKLPTVECPSHGRQCVDPPWGEQNWSLSRTLVETVDRLAREWGDMGMAARYFQVEPALVDQVLRSGGKETGKAGGRGGSGQGARQQTAPVRQPSLFQQSDMSFANRGIQAFRNMELEQAVEFLKKHRKLYPKGFDVVARLESAEFLLRGIRGAPANAADQPGYLCRLWDSFENYVKSEHAGREALIDEIRPAFFTRVADMLGEYCVSAPSVLPGNFWPGYVLLQAGRYDDAIRSLQRSILKAPQDAALHGYLGDAYSFRKNTRAARQCYREACLIDPSGIDWRRVHDEDMNELKQDLLLIYGPDKELALAWFPSYARVNGLFERKVVHLHNGLKEMVDEYIATEKALRKEKSAVLSAGLFFRGIILCENEGHLKFIKKVDPIRIRKIMKESNPDLFADFLKMIAPGR